MSEYFTATVAHGISGDDVIRRRREKSLGFSEPSKDWAECDKEIRCIYPGQVIVRHSLDAHRGVHVHSKLAFWKPPYYNGDPIRCITWRTGNQHD